MEQKNINIQQYKKEMLTSAKAFRCIFLNPGNTKILLRFLLFSHQPNKARWLTTNTLNQIKLFASDLSRYNPSSLTQEIQSQVSATQNQFIVFVEDKRKAPNFVFPYFFLSLPSFPPATKITTDFFNSNGQNPPGVPRIRPRWAQPLPQGKHRCSDQNTKEIGDGISSGGTGRGENPELVSSLFGGASKEGKDGSEANRMVTEKSVTGEWS